MKIYIDSETLFEEYEELPEKIAELVLKYNLNKQDVLNCFFIYWNRYVNDNDLAYIIYNECLTVAYREAIKFVYENIEECILKSSNDDISKYFHNHIEFLLIHGVIISSINIFINIILNYIWHYMKLFTKVFYFIWSRIIFNIFTFYYNSMN